MVAGLLGGERCEDLRCPATTAVVGPGPIFVPVLSDPRLIHTGPNPTPENINDSNAALLYFQCSSEITAQLKSEEAILSVQKSIILLITPML